MKLIRAGIMSAVMVVMMCGGVFAQGAFVPQGSAIVPDVTAWQKDSTNSEYTKLHLTNITGSNIHVKIKVYNHDGLDVTYYGKVYTGSSTYKYVTVASGTGEFDMPAHSSRVFLFVAPSQMLICGNAVVEWSSDDMQLHKALLVLLSILDGKAIPKEVGRILMEFKLTTASPSKSTNKARSRGLII